MIWSAARSFFSRSGTVFTRVSMFIQSITEDVGQSFGSTVMESRKPSGSALSLLSSASMAASFLIVRSAKLRGWGPPEFCPR